MGTPIVLPAAVLQYARQIYYNVKRPDRLQKLKQLENRAVPVEDLEDEVYKMFQLHKESNDILLKTVRDFLQASKKARPPATLDDFVKQLNKIIHADTNDDLDGIDVSVLDEGMSDEEKDEFDEFDDLDDDAILQATEQPSTKRCLEEDSEEQPTVKRARQMSNGNMMRSMTPTDMMPTPAASPPVDTAALLMAQEQQQAAQYAGCNVLVTPLRSTMGFLEGIPWILQFEIGRFVQHHRIAWGTIGVDAMRSFIHEGMTNAPNMMTAMAEWYAAQFDIAELSSHIQNKRLAASLAIEKCSDHVWSACSAQFASPTYHDPATPATPATPTSTSSTLSNSSLGTHTAPITTPTNATRTVHYSARLHFINNSRPPSIKLQPPVAQASNRFFRKFGADRFLELRLEQRRPRNALKEHANFLCKPLILMGRSYSFLFLKDDRLVYFATKGPNLTTIRINEVINWHIPIVENWNMTVNKFASRMTLGYSNSISTVTFEPDNVKVIRDLYATTGGGGGDEACMTDGCGLISPAAMRRIMEIHNLSNKVQALPCAVQGRIGGAKGLWIIPHAFEQGDDADMWIKIRDSQYKFKTGLPGVDLKHDPLHFTFDLCKVAFCVYPSHLNTQFIQAMAAGGVPIKVFVELLKDVIFQMTNTLTDKKNTHLLRDWVYKQGGLLHLRRLGAIASTANSSWQRQLQPEYLDDFTLDDDDGNDNESDDTVVDTPQRQARDFGTTSVRMYHTHSGYPSHLYEAIVRMLDAGFEPSNSHLANKIRMVFKRAMTNIATKYRIEVPQSCTVMCVPDPTGILEENQVYLRLSNRHVDERTGLYGGIILGDILVARNPCGVKSDVQKVQAVDCPDLRVYVDVIVFSVKGPRSIASKLSGGDYDGDLIFCCWDERLVEPFDSSPVVEPLKEVDLAFEKDDRKIRDCLRDIMDPDDRERKLQQLLLATTALDGTLGQFENWRTVLSEIASLDDPRVIYLAQMCSKLVDAPKQGLTVRGSVRSRDYERFHKNPVPQWFAEKLRHVDGESTRGAELLVRKPSTAMEHLHDTLNKELDALTKQAHPVMADNNAIEFRDTDIADIWDQWRAYANKLDDKDLEADLQAIKCAIDASFSSYQKDVSDVMLLLTAKSQRGKAKNTNNTHGPSPTMTMRVAPTSNTSSDPSSSDNASSPPSPARATNNAHDNMTITCRDDYEHAKYQSLFQVEEFHTQHYFHLLMDPKDLKSSLLRSDILLTGGRNIQDIKASYAYIKSIQHRKYCKYAYVMAHDNLMRIKAEAVAKQSKITGVPPAIIPAFYDGMSFDRRWLRQ
ncbi:RNA dependent RNA polymerase-domain-containing protein [Gongronella butleri]|nr:RNA dependent RNA polymerase-domain-containing protein [Gongronella butleri]